MNQIQPPSEDNYNKKDLPEIYNKEDIMNMLKCESAKALRLLRLMHQMNIAIKIGREYYVYKEEFVQFLDDFKGKTIVI